MLILLIGIFGVWLWMLVLRKWRGYHTDMTGGAEGGTISYHERNRYIEIYFNRFPFIIQVPTDEAWQRGMPDWAKERKTEIMSRIERDFKRAQWEETGRVFGA